MDPELVLQLGDELRCRVEAGLQPHDRPEATTKELRLESVEEIVCVVRDREIRVTCDPKNRARGDLAPANDFGQIVKNRLFQRQLLRRAHRQSMNRGTSAGTFTRRKRGFLSELTVGDQADIEHESGDIREWRACPTAIGVSRGWISRRNRFLKDWSSREPHSSIEMSRIPSCSSEGRRSSSQSESWAPSSVSNLLPGLREGLCRVRTRRGIFAALVPAT